MRVIIDTNIISDIVTQDPNWSIWSATQLQQYGQDELVINGIIYGELSYGYESQTDVDEIVSNFGLTLDVMPRSAFFLASKAYEVYRQRGGNKTCPLPDFFIGAHAEAEGCPILTRDVKRYKTYFPTVTLIAPP